MTTLVRRGAAALALAGAVAATSLLAATPALADTPAEPYPGCTEPIDGAVLCYNVSKSPTNPVAYASLYFADGERSFAAAVVTLERCADDRCIPVAVDGGRDVQTLGTDTVSLDHGDDGYYRANASWLDDQGNRHVGVTAQVGGDA
jgi:hypothetical protein